MENIPVFPDNYPEITRYLCYEYTAKDLTNDEAYNKIVKLLFWWPEAYHYYYQEVDTRFSPRFDHFGIIIEKSKPGYYLIDNEYGSLFFYISQEELYFADEIKKKALEKIKNSSKQYYRSTLKLLEVEKRYLENEELIKQQSKRWWNYGISIPYTNCVTSLLDLKNAGWWLWKKFLKSNKKHK